MPTIKIQAQLSKEDLLEAVEQLSLSELEGFFQDREGNLDNYGKHSFLEYLDFMENPYTYVRISLFHTIGHVSIYIHIYRMRAQILQQQR